MKEIIIYYMYTGKSVRMVKNGEKVSIKTKKLENSGLTFQDVQTPI